MQQKSFVTYTIPWIKAKGGSTTPSVTLLESRAIISSSGTTGFRTWEAALHLSAWLTESETVREKTVLELGAGTGLVSLLCTTFLGASRVIATDGDEGLIEELKTNVFLNNTSTSSKFGVAIFKWGSTLQNVVRQPDNDDDNSTWDIVLGADVVSSKILWLLSMRLTRSTQTYDVSVMPALVATLRDLFDTSPKLQVILSATVRNQDTLDAFTKACSKCYIGPKLCPFTEQ